MAYLDLNRPHILCDLLWDNEIRPFIRVFLVFFLFNRLMGSSLFELLGFHLSEQRVDLIVGQEGGTRFEDLDEGIIRY